MISVTRWAWKPPKDVPFVGRKPNLIAVVAGQFDIAVQASFGPQNIIINQEINH